MEMQRSVEAGDRARIDDALTRAQRMKISLDHLLEGKVDEFMFSNMGTYQLYEDSPYFYVKGIVRNPSENDFEQVVFEVNCKSRVDGLEHKQKIVIRNLPRKDSRAYIAQTTVRRPLQEMTLVSKAEGPASTPDFELGDSWVVQNGPAINVVWNRTGKQWDTVRVNLVCFDALGKLIRVEPLDFQDFLANSGQRFEVRGGKLSRLDSHVDFCYGIEAQIGR